MKKNILLILALIGLAIVAYYLFEQNKKTEKSTISADRGFTISSMDEVSKLVLKRAEEPAITFSRGKEGWLLNEKYEVDPAVFVNIEVVLTKMRLSYVPNDAAIPNIEKSIKKTGIQVDIYGKEDKPIKIFFVGSDAPQGNGTYMWLAGEDTPYVMQLPGLSGGLRSRFDQPFHNYRNKMIYNHKSGDIERITVEYPKDNFSSFVIEKSMRGLEIQPLLDLTEKNKGQLNKITLERYIKNFGSMGIEGNINSFPGKDSIVVAIPNCILTIQKSDGNEIKHKYWSHDNYLDNRGTSRTPQEIRQQERMFIQTQDGDFYIAQQRVIGNIFKGYNEFFE